MLDVEDAGPVTWPCIPTEAVMMLMLLLMLQLHANQLSCAVISHHVILTTKQVCLNTDLQL